MSEWKQFRAPLTTKMGIAEPHLRPDTPSSIIQQIASAMSNPSQLYPTQHDCDGLLKELPVLSSPTQTDPIEPPNELQKLLDSGYKPLDKIDGEWVEETPQKQDQLLLEDQK